MIKGIDTREDTRLAIEHGVDGILVSNHGGRATETGRSTIEALPEVVAEAGSQIPIFLDGGVRRAAGPTSSKRSRWAPGPSGSAVRSSGG